MSTTESQLDSLLKELDAAPKLEEMQIATRLSALGSSDGTASTAPHLSAELIAFHFQESDEESKNCCRSFFRPLSVMPNQDGSKTEYPDGKQITPEMIDYWLKRGTDAHHPVMIARYLSLVWFFSKQVCKASVNVKVARMAIAAILEIADRKLHNHDIHVIPKLAWALGTAVSIASKQDIAQVVTAILSYEDSMTDDSKPGLWGFSFDLLIDNPKVALKKSQESKIISDLETRLRRLSNVSRSGGVDPWAAEHAAVRLATYYRKQQSIKDLERVLETYTQTFEEHCKAGSPLQISFWLQRVISTLAPYGMASTRERLVKQLSALGPRMKEDMKEIRVEVPVDMAKITKAIEDITDGDLLRVLDRIATRFVIRKTDTEKQVHNLARKAPLSFLFSMQIQDNAGRPVASVGSLEEDLDGHIIQHMSQNMQFMSSFLNDVMRKAQAKLDLTATNCVKHLYRSPAFSADRRDIMKFALEAYFTDQHFAFAHLVVPQIEHAFRRIAELRGGNVLRPNRNGGFDYRGLGDILRDNAVVQTFGADVNTYFRVVLTEQTGWNIRNNVCHGLMPTLELSPAVSDRLFHILLCIALVRPKEKK